MSIHHENGHPHQFNLIDNNNNTKHGINKILVSTTTTANNNSGVDSKNNNNSTLSYPKIYFQYSDDTDDSIPTHIKENSIATIDLNDKFEILSVSSPPSSLPSSSSKINNSLSWHQYHDTLFIHLNNNRSNGNNEKNSPSSSSPIKITCNDIINSFPEDEDICNLLKTLQEGNERIHQLMMDQDLKQLHFASTTSSSNSSGVSTSSNKPSSINTSGNSNQNNGSNNNNKKKTPQLTITTNIQELLNHNNEEMLSPTIISTGNITNNGHQAFNNNNQKVNNNNQGFSPFSHLKLSPYSASKGNSRNAIKIDHSPVRMNISPYKVESNAQLFKNNNNTNGTITSSNTTIMNNGSPISMLNKQVGNNEMIIDDLTPNNIQNILNHSMNSIRMTLNDLEELSFNEAGIITNKNINYQSVKKRLEF
ncbi:hypothetical protein ABK040_015320 [Willaertia magna]